MLPEAQERRNEMLLRRKEIEIKISEEKDIWTGMTRIESLKRTEQRDTRTKRVVTRKVTKGIMKKSDSILSFIKS